MFGWFRKQPDDGLPAPEDRYDKAILGDIRRVGWSVIQIAGNDPEEGSPPYSFTVGLFHTHKHPEIILIGMRNDFAGQIINTIGAAVVLGDKMETGSVRNEFANVPLAFVEVDPGYYQQFTGYALWLHGGSNFPMLQCVWPLKSGHFPWDAGYEKAGAEIQPLLSRAVR